MAIGPVSQLPTFRIITHDVSGGINQQADLLKARAHPMGSKFYRLTLGGNLNNIPNHPNGLTFGGVNRFM